LKDRFELLSAIGMAIIMLGLVFGSLLLTFVESDHAASPLTQTSLPPFLFPPELDIPTASIQVSTPAITNTATQKTSATLTKTARPSKTSFPSKTPQPTMPANSSNPSQTVAIITPGIPIQTGTAGSPEKSTLTPRPTSTLLPVTVISNPFLKTMEASTATIASYPFP